MKRLGLIGLFIGSVFISFRHSVRQKGLRYQFHSISEQMSKIYTRSIGTVIFSGLFVGAILVIQFNLMLKQYDSQSLLGALNTSTAIREVGPLIISFLLAGRVGAFIAAELGTMRVTSQIDAIECLGANSMEYLVVPRFIAISLSSVLLLVAGLLVSVLGSIVVADLFCGVNPVQYVVSISRFTDGWTLFCGIFRSFVYGVIVAAVSCYEGFYATGGARGVGRAVTLAAIFTNLYIVIANFVTGSVLEILTYYKDILFGSSFA